MTMLSYFPLVVRYKGGRKELVKTPEEIKSGVAFVILRCNATKGDLR